MQLLINGQFLAQAHHWCWFCFYCGGKPVKTLD